MKYKELFEWKPSEIRSVVNPKFSEKDMKFGSASSVVNSRMRDSGYIKIGKGVHGTVYSRDGSDVVVKVFSQDTCWEVFHDYCMKNKGNPHLPRMSKIVPINGAAIGANVVFMEKLQEMPKSAYLENIGLRSYIYLETGFSYPKQLRHENTRQELEVNAGEFKKNNQLLCKTISEVLNLTTTCFCDLHDGNIMLRGNTIVIIDPLA